MRHAIPTVLAAAALVAPAAAPAPAAGAQAQLMVVGRGGEVLRAPGSVALKARRARVGSRRCTVGGATPLGVLLGTRLRLRLRDYGACGRSAADAGGLYVAGVAGQRERGRGGWVYKIGRRSLSVGAGDRRARVRAGARALWFWCEQGSGGGCQRTLEAQPDRRTAAPGETLRVTVRGYDDNGRGRPVPGATVRLGSATATTGADGRALVAVPDGGGRLFAARAGLVRSFPVRISTP